MRISFFILLLLVKSSIGFSQSSPREHLLMDKGWRFAFGHPFDAKKTLVTVPLTSRTSLKRVMAMALLRQILMTATGAN